MARSVEHIISKCIEGKASRDIVKALVEEMPDIPSIRTHLVRDLNRSGCIVKSSQLNVEDSVIQVTVPRSSRRIVESVVSTYSQIYQDVEVFITYQS